MRRTAAVLITAGTLVAGFVAPADAATNTVTHAIVVGDDTTGAGAQVGGLMCTGTTVDPTPKLHMALAGSVPADPNSPVPQSWTSASSVPAGQAWGMSPGSESLSAAQLGSLKVDVYNGPSGVAGMIAVALDTSTATPSLRIFAGKSPIPAGTAGQWSTVDESAAAYDWNEYSTPTSPTAEPAWKASAGTSTLASFDAAHSGLNSMVLYTPILAFGCAGESFAVQHLQWGAAGATALNSVDLGTLANAVSIAPSAKFISAGGAVTLNGSAKYGAAATAVLSFKDIAVGTYSTASRAAYSTVIDQLKCDATESVCGNPFTGVVAHPLHNTIYKWTYAGANGVDPAASIFVMVHVQTLLKPSWPASTQYVGKSFKMNGTTVPLKPGSKITLWGRNGSFVQNFGPEPISSDGKWYGSLKFNQRGTWTFWYTIGNDRANAGSKSATRTIYIR